MAEILKKKKGQMFVIAAIFMIVGIIFLRNVLSLPAITQEKTFQDTTYLGRNMDNIRNEFDYMTGIASVQPNPNVSGANYILNFSDYIDTQFDSRIFYVFVYSNGTSRNVSVTLGNYMGNNMSGVLNLSNSTPYGYGFDLNDRSYTTLQFNFTPAFINLTLNYSMNNRQTFENFYFNGSSDNYISALFDISLQDTGFFVRSKSVYNRTW